MEFGKAFVYQFEDQEWLKKLGIGALLLLIPLLGQLWIAGWSLEITKRVIRRDPQPLADWDDFGGYLVRGFLVFIIGFVYALPIILVSTCVSVLFPSAFDPSASNEVATSAWIVFACVNCVIILYSILLAFIIPAALGNYAVKEQFGAAFRFGEVWGLVRAAPGAYILKATRLIITRVTYKIDESGGQASVLDLGIPNIYDGTEPKLEDLPWVG